MDFYRFLEEIKKFQNLDFSGAKLGTSEKPFTIEGEYNRIDLSGAKGQVIIKSNFTNYIDASGCKGLELVLVGCFNIIDASGGKIKIDAQNAKINILDLSFGVKE